QGSLHTTFPFTLLALSQRQLTHCVRRNEMQKRCIRSQFMTLYVTPRQYLTNRKQSCDLHIFCEYAAQGFATSRQTHIFPHVRPDFYTTRSPPDRKSTRLNSSHVSIS